MEEIKEIKEIKGAIIIPSYNKAEYLEDCIKSALMQEAPFPIYVILSDDASSDSSPMICETYSRNYPDRIINIGSVENMGVVPNVYKCVKYALSLGVTHLLLLGCDDFLCFKNYFYKQVLFLLSNPAFVLTFANSHFIGKEYTLLMELKSQKAPVFNFKDSRINANKIIIEGDTMPIGTVVFDTKYMNDYFEGFATDDVIKSFMAEDLPLLLFHSRYGKFAKCEVDALAVRDLVESASRSANIAKVEAFSRSCLYIQQRYISLYENNNPKLLLKAEQFYEMKMLRRVAKIQPEAYLSRLWYVLRKYPQLVLNRVVMRSVLVYLRNR